jgi:hypothetical protein
MPADSLANGEMETKILQGHYVGIVVSDIFTPI